MHTGEMYKLFFLERTELELHVIAVVFNQAGILYICISVLTLCYLCQSRFQHSDNTATRKTFYCCVRRVQTVRRSDHCKPCLKRNVSSIKSFGLSMLLDLDNHNYCRCMQQVTLLFKLHRTVDFCGCTSHTVSLHSATEIVCHSEFHSPSAAITNTHTLYHMAQMVPSAHVYSTEC